MARREKTNGDEKTVKGEKVAWKRPSRGRLTDRSRPSLGNIENIETLELVAILSAIRSVRAW